MLRLCLEQSAHCILKIKRPVDAINAVDVIGEFGKIARRIIDK